jgi:tape measure domain-containing protein
MAIEIEVKSNSRQAQRDIDKLKASISGIEQNTQQMSRGLTDTLNSIGTAARVAGGLLTGFLSANALSRASDSFKNINSQLKLTVKSSNELVFAQKEINKLAFQTGTSIKTLGPLYARLARSANSLGASQKDVAIVTGAIAKSFKISGAEAVAAEQATRQLVQGLQSGVLRGDEFNSVMEQAPRIAESIAKQLGIATDQLRNLAAEGKISSRTVFKALLNDASDLNKEFNSLIPTVGFAISKLSIGSNKFLASLDKALGFSTALEKRISGVANFLNKAADRIVPFFISIRVGLGQILSVAELTARKLLFAFDLSAAYDSLKKVITDIKTEFWDLYIYLVGNSVVPDMIDEIVDQFKRLPAEVLDGLKSFKDNVQATFNNIKINIDPQSLKTGIAGVQNDLSKLTKSLTLEANLDLSNMLFSDQTRALNFVQKEAAKLARDISDILASNEPDYLKVITLQKELLDLGKEAEAIKESANGSSTPRGASVIEKVLKRYTDSETGLSNVGYDLGTGLAFATGPMLTLIAMSNQFGANLLEGINDLKQADFSPLQEKLVKVFENAWKGFTVSLGFAQAEKEPFAIKNGVFGKNEPTGSGTVLQLPPALLPTSSKEGASGLLNGINNIYDLLDAVFGGLESATVVAGFAALALLTKGGAGTNAIRAPGLSVANALTDRSLGNILNERQTKLQAQQTSAALQAGVDVPAVREYNQALAAQAEQLGAVEKLQLKVTSLRAQRASESNPEIRKALNVEIRKNQANLGIFQQRLNAADANVNKISKSLETFGKGTRQQRQALDRLRTATAQLAAVDADLKAIQDRSAERAARVSTASRQVGGLLGEGLGAVGGIAAGRAFIGYVEENIGELEGWQKAGILVSTTITGQVLGSAIGTLVGDAVGVAINKSLARISESTIGVALGTAIGSAAGAAFGALTSIYALVGSKIAAGFAATTALFVRAGAAIAAGFAAAKLLLSQIGFAIGTFFSIAASRGLMVTALKAGAAIATAFAVGLPAAITAATAALVVAIGLALSGVVLAITIPEDFERLLQDFLGLSPEWAESIRDFLDGPDWLRDFVASIGSFLRRSSGNTNGTIPEGGDTDYGFASGGYVSGSGTGTSDSIHAMLSNGEYVINAAATRQNKGLLEAINSGQVPKFAKGGFVGDMFSTTNGMFGFNESFFAPSKTPYLHEDLVSQLKKEEGFRSKAYLDSQGFPTIGYGQLLSSKVHTKKELAKQFGSLQQSESEAHTWMLNYLNTTALPDAIDFVGADIFENLPVPARDAVISTAYNLGRNKLGGFKNFREGLQTSDFAKAGRELLDSDAATQAVFRYGELAASLFSLAGVNPKANMPDKYRETIEERKAKNLDVPMQYYATGGHVKGTGTGTSDSIPAMLSNGEFVVNAKATKANMGLLAALNGGLNIGGNDNHFNRGGLALASSASGVFADRSLREHLASTLSLIGVESPDQTTESLASKYPVIGRNIDKSLNKDVLDDIKNTTGVNILKNPQGLAVHFSALLAKDAIEKKGSMGFLETLNTFLNDVAPNVGVQVPGYNGISDLPGFLLDSSELLHKVLYHTTGLNATKLRPLTYAMADSWDTRDEQGKLGLAEMAFLREGVPTAAHYGALGGIYGAGGGMLKNIAGIGKTAGASLKSLFTGKTSLKGGFKELGSLGSDLVLTLGSGLAKGGLAGGIWGGILGSFTGGLSGTYSELVNMLSGRKSDKKDLKIPENLTTDYGFASGGYVSGPGTGTSDSIPAMLSNGEFVIKASAVRALGTKRLEALNQGQLPKFKNGGSVGDDLASDLGRLGFSTDNLKNLKPLTIESLEMLVESLDTLNELMADNVKEGIGNKINKATKKDTVAAITDLLSPNIESTGVSGSDNDKATYNVLSDLDDLRRTGLQLDKISSEELNVIIGKFSKIDALKTKIAGLDETQVQEYVKLNAELDKNELSLDNTVEKLKQGTDLVKRMRSSFQGTLQGVFEGVNDLNDVFDNLLKTIANTAIENVTGDITDSLFGSLNDSSFSNGIASLFGSDTEKDTTSGNGGISGLPEASESVMTFTQGLQGGISGLGQWASTTLQSIAQFFGLATATTAQTTASATATASAGLLTGAFTALTTAAFSASAALSMAAASSGTAGALSIAGSFADGGITPRGGAMMLHPNEMILNPRQQKHLFEQVNNNRSGSINQVTQNINITGDISRQTKKEIYSMMPSIAQGVNQQNKETNR